MRNYYKTNSHYLTYTLSLKNVGRMYFLSLGVKGLIAWTPSIIFFFHVSLTSFPVPHHNWVAALADFLLQLQHAIQQGLGSGWTARDVDVDRNNAITATDNSIRIMIVASTIRTAAFNTRKITIMKRWECAAQLSKGTVPWKLHHTAMSWQIQLTPVTFKQNYNPGQNYVIHLSGSFSKTWPSPFPPSLLPPYDVASRGTLWAHWFSIAWGRRGGNKEKL